MITGAHPRSRGENLPTRGEPVRYPGSSPLTRGKRLNRVAVLVDQGLIPAHAGKTSRAPSSVDHSGAHPRSRGENRFDRMRLNPRQGSSPLTRGKQPLQDRRAQRHRLIPAHAGKTWVTASESLSGKAHPRSRGENEDCVGVLQCEVGSSPLTRGKHHRRRHGPRRHGLIPAHAGKTRRRSCSRRTCRAHPRSRGENPLSPAFLAPLSGSSPLTRGKHLGDALECLEVRLIPAHAGKTARSALFRASERAHPRSRGENPSRSLT